MHLKSTTVLGALLAALLISFFAASAPARTLVAVAPPKCSDAGNPALETGYLPGRHVVQVSTNDGSSPPTWTRNCGPAVVHVLLNGASYRISGGRCGIGAVLFDAHVGLQGATPAAPAKLFVLDASDPRHRAGTFKLSNASIQLLGRAFAMPGAISTGTVTIGRSLRAGTFALRLDDATRVTGSFACGSRQGTFPTAGPGEPPFDSARPEVIA
jgi:hypothetical protein